MSLTLGQTCVDYHHQSGWELRRGLSWKSTCYTRVVTWVQSPRAHRKHGDTRLSLVRGKWRQNDSQGPGAIQSSHVCEPQVRRETWPHRALSQRPEFDSWHPQSDSSQLPVTPAPEDLKVFSTICTHMYTHTEKETDRSRETERDSDEERERDRERDNTAQADLQIMAISQPQSPEGGSCRCEWPHSVLLWSFNNLSLSEPQLCTSDMEVVALLRG